MITDEKNRALEDFKDIKSKYEETRVEYEEINQRNKVRNVDVAHTWCHSNYVIVYPSLLRRHLFSYGARNTRRGDLE